MLPRVSPRYTRMACYQYLSAFYVTECIILLSEEIVEQLPLNQRVQGSSPCAPTIKKLII